MVPAMFSFGFLERVAKNRKVVVVLEITGDLFNDRVRRHSNVSVEDACSSLCSGLFMALV